MAQSMILNVDFVFLFFPLEMFPFSVFNAIVRVCLKQFLPAVYRFLRIKNISTSQLKPNTSSNWKYLEAIMKKYLNNFIRVWKLSYSNSFLPDKFS